MRAMWNGSISFGLVNVPVRLYSAVSRKSVRFNQLDEKSGSRVRLKKVSASTGEDVPAESILRGYEVSPDNYVVVTDDELAGLDPDAARTIDLQEFVDLDQIDPIYFDSAYYLAPDPNLAKSYALLVEAMKKANKAGIARFVMRGRQYLAAIRPQDDHLVLSTLVYGDEVNDVAEIPELDAVKDIELPKKELEMASQLIETLATEFDPERYHDTYREQVMDLIQRKSAGEEIVADVGAEPQTPVVDLIAALEASVADAKKARKKKPAAAATRQRKSA